MDMARVLRLQSSTCLGNDGPKRCPPVQGYSLDHMTPSLPLHFTGETLNHIFPDEYEYPCCTVFPAGMTAHWEHDICKLQHVRTWDLIS